MILKLYFREENTLDKSRLKTYPAKYADENGFQNTRFYVDDGYSGANFNRPAFEQMMDDMSNGDIAVIITKDLSRLGRNQLHTGLYIEEIFPSNDVRYIAVNDNVDTKYENSNELMPFKNLFNEWHVRDCSRKVRNVVNAKAQRGIRVGTRAPYGYRKGATKDSPLLVDEEAAAVVKRIFAMCAGGMGPAQIAKQLKKECIYSPSMYAYTKFGTSHSGLNAERPYNWTGDMVADMLQNMVYLGHTVNLRYSTKSYKDKNDVNAPNQSGLSLRILMKSWWIRKPGISYRRCDLISAAARIWMSRICSLDWCIVRTAVSPWYCTGRTP